MSSLFRADGLLLNQVDFSQAAGVERFECQDCKRTGPLTIHGRCGTCGSDAVISDSKIAAKQ
jgi:hypothetical protein